MKVIANLVLFQILWLCTVAGAGKGYWWAGLPVLALFAAYQLKVSAHPRADAMLMLICAVVGLVADTLLIQMGLIRFAQPFPSSALAPVWIIVLWVGFSLTLNHSLAFLKGKMALAIVFGLLGGPLAYAVAGKVWGAAFFTAPDLYVYGALAIIWGAMTPLLLSLASRFVARPALPAVS